MLRSLANFFRCSTSQVNQSILNFPQKLLEEVNTEIIYRQKFSIICTLLTGLLTMSGTLAGLTFVFKHLHHKVSELTEVNLHSDEIENIVDYYSLKAFFYGFLPVGSVALLGGELKYFYSELKKYYHYAEKTPISDLSPALYEKVKDYLKTIQYTPDYLTLEDLQEILIQEIDNNSIHEKSGVYYAI